MQEFLVFRSIVGSALEAARLDIRQWDYFDFPSMRKYRSA